MASTVLSYLTAINNTETNMQTHTDSDNLTQNSTRALVLSIAGSDSAGLAGIQMDCRTINALGGHAVTCITANSAQNNQQMIQLNAVSASVLRSQLEAVSQLNIGAIKIGLIANADQVSIICDFVDQISKNSTQKNDQPNPISVIYDPVISTSSGSQLLDQKTLSAIKQHLITRCSLITPNLYEAEQLSGLSIDCAQDRIKAAQKIHQLGARNILIKGGHAYGDYSQDLFSSLGSANTSEPKQAFNQNSTALYLSSKAHQFWLSSQRIKTNNNRGTGCALSSSAATALALGYSLHDAVVIAKMAINQGLRQGYALPLEKGPVAIQSFPDSYEDLPYLTPQADFDFSQAEFLACNQTPLGLYPVVNSLAWLKVVIEAGVTTAQIRIKDKPMALLEKELVDCIEYAKKHHCRLFINDYWQLAIKHHAYGVHLGQEDLQSADLKQILKANLRLGISSHCHYEVATAHSFKPSYIACGPVFHTNSKQMPWQPLGLKGLNYWRRVLPYPLVAIGGINQQRFALVCETQVDAVAMISAISLAKNPTKSVKNYIEQFKQSTLSHYFDNKQSD